MQIDLRGRSDVADYMVICSGRSSRQVAAISEKLADRLKQGFGIGAKMEGKETGDWVLIDTGMCGPRLPPRSARVLPAREDVASRGAGGSAACGGPEGLMRLHLCAVGRLRAGPSGLWSTIIWTGWARRAGPSASAL